MLSALHFPHQKTEHKMKDKQCDTQIKYRTKYKHGLHSVAIKFQALTILDKTILFVIVRICDYEHEYSRRYHDGQTDTASLKHFFSTTTKIFL